MRREAVNENVSMQSSFGKWHNIVWYRPSRKEPQLVRAQLPLGAVWVPESGHRSHGPDWHPAASIFGPLSTVDNARCVGWRRPELRDMARQNVNQEPLALQGFLGLCVCFWLPERTNWPRSSEKIRSAGGSGTEASPSSSVSLTVHFSVCLPICPFVHLSVCLFICLSICLFIHLSIWPFICLSLCLSDHLSDCLIYLPGSVHLLSVHLSSLSGTVHLSVYSVWVYPSATCPSVYPVWVCPSVYYIWVCPSACLSICLPCLGLSICLSVRLSFHLSVSLSVHLFIHLSVSICPSVCLFYLLNLPCPSVCPSVYCPSIIHLSVHLSDSICPSVCPSLWLHAFPSVCLSFCYLLKRYPHANTEIRPWTLKKCPWS